MRKQEPRSGKKIALQKWVIAGSALAVALLLLTASMLEEFKYLAAVLWILVVLVFLWFGNRFIHQKLNKVLPWAQQSFKRFFIQLLASSLYSLACVNVLYFLFKSWFMGMPPDLEQVLVLNLYGLLFLVPIVSFNFGIYFMVQWKKTFIQSEKLREENLRTQFESLKNHIDPHFLFNNLNVLSSLIDKNPGEAHQFLNKFSDVYRYVLLHRNEELVTVQTELAFIQSYTFLFQQRLNKQLRISIAIPPSERFYLPPLSVQMLVENAIKHNKATVSKPLAIDIFMEEDRLIVRNTYQPKLKEPSDLPQTGLDNIHKRFAYFSERSVEVVQDDAFFIVKLPLLEWEEVGHQPDVP